MGPAARPAVRALAARFQLDPAAAGRLDGLVEGLAHAAWAPTTVTEPGAVVDRHLADGLVALELPTVREAAVIADLGAGAGFPGLALASALPSSRVHLVESARRKAGFIRELAAAAGIANAEVVALRAEQWQEGLATCELVTARALAALPVVLEYAAPLLREGGTVVVWRGRRDPAEEAVARIAARVLGLGPGEVVAVRPFPAAAERHLHRYVKQGPTPDRFPRRPGAARKRPLGRVP